MRKNGIRVAVLCLLAMLMFAAVLAEEKVAFLVVKYDGNGATMNMPVQSVEAGETITVSDGGYGRTGYVFSGWSKAPDAEKAEYLPGDTCVVTEDTTFYAVWVKGRDLGTVSGPMTYEISYPLTGYSAYVEFQVAKDGYYRIQSTGGYYKNVSAYQRLEDKDTGNRVSNGEQVGDEFAVVAELKAGGYGRTGYVFSGWSKAPDAEKAEYLPGDTCVVTEDTTFYAVWVKGRDLGTVSGPMTYEISYPLTGYSAYVEFQVAKDGYYRIQSTGGYYKNVSAYQRLEDKDTGNRVSNGEKVGDEFAVVAELKAGVTYQLNYNHGYDPLNLFFQPQYDGANFVSDMRLSGGIEIIERSSFEGTGMQQVAISADVDKVESRAFADCTWLKRVLFYSASTQIAPDAFAGCSGLTIIAPLNSPAQALAEANGWIFLELK